MATLEFEDLKFKQLEQAIRVTLYDLFYFEIPNSELITIAPFTVTTNTITFKEISEKKASNKFNILLSKYSENLLNTIRNKKAVYIHKNSGIPLIGNINFGLVDRNTNCIELKPITSCNLNCIYCSVDEGKDSKKTTDYVVEKDSLVEEFRKLVKFKNTDHIEAHIGPQGEPLLYTKLEQLIRDLSNIPQVKTISIDTNGTLLTQEKVDKLVAAGLTRINLSFDAFDQELATKIAGAPINIDHIKDISNYIASKIDLLVAPVLVQKINTEEIPKIIRFLKTLPKEKVQVGIQNFLSYKSGRNPTKELSWEDFTKQLKQWEEELDIKLLISAEDFHIVKTKPLPKPFQKGDIIKATIVCKGRSKKELIAVAQDRNITVLSSNAEIGQKIKLQILRDKHNIFLAKQV